MEESLAEYQKIRARDYQDYFDLVCSAAEMNNYSQEELKYFYSIKNNQNLVNQIISKFGDTLPVSADVEANLLPDEEYPDSINMFNPANYSSSFPIRGLNSTFLEKTLVKV